jgi:hypothetical protein
MINKKKNSIYWYIGKRFGINVSDPENESLLNDLYQETMIYAIEKGFIIDSFLNEIQKDENVKSEYNSFLLKTVKFLRGHEASYPDEENWDYPSDVNLIDEIEEIFHKRDSKIGYNYNEKEIIGQEILEKILPKIEYDSYLYKTQKSPEYDFSLLSGLKQSGIDVFFKRAIVRVKIFQGQERIEKNIKKYK